MAKPRITSQSLPSLVFPNMYVYICIKWTDLQSAASFTGGYLADGFSTFELCGPRAYLPTSLAPIALMTLQGEMPARTLEGNVQCGFFSQQNNPRIEILWKARRHRKFGKFLGLTRLANNKAQFFSICISMIWMIYCMQLFQMIKIMFLKFLNKEPQTMA